MTLATLAIQAEAWLQEELGGQRATLAVLGRIDAAARAGTTAELDVAGRELAACLAVAGARDARRQALLGRLAGALGLPARGFALSKVVARLAAEGAETHRLEALRSELREVVAAVVKAGRRLAAVARYHQGLQEELCQLLVASAPGAGDGHLIDARA